MLPYSPLKRKSPELLFRAFSFIGSPQSTEEDIMATCSIRQNRRIYNLAAGATLPGIKSTNKIIIFLCVHAGFTLGTFHGITSCL